MPWNFKEILKRVESIRIWPEILRWVTMNDICINMKSCSLSKSDMETFYYMLSEKNPFGQCKISSLNLCKNPIRKEGAKILAPAIATNKSLQFLNLSGCKFGVSGIVQVAEALKENKTIKTLNLYSNIADVDGARNLGKMLEVNSTLEFIDLGHNRIRITGLAAIMDGILANPTSKITSLGLRANFISDEGITQLFEKLILPKEGRPQQLTSVFLKQNFLTEYHKVALYNKSKAAGIVGKIYVDEFEVCELLPKERLDKSIWISPVPKGMLRQENAIGNFFQKSYDCGLVIDVRLRVGRTVPGRTRENCFAIIEYAHENSIPRSLKLASK